MCLFRDGRDRQGAKGLVGSSGASYQVGYQEHLQDRIRTNGLLLKFKMSVGQDKRDHPQLIAGSA